MNSELALKFSNYVLPDDVKANYKMFGSLNLIKTLLFAQDNKLTNDDIDYYMSIPPMTQEGETYEEMKIRSKFSRVLLKYRPYLYDYSVYDKN